MNTILAVGIVIGGLIVAVGICWAAEYSKKYPEIMGKKDRP